MTDSKRQALSVLLGLGLVIIMLAIMSIDDFRDFTPPDTVIRRNVEIYTPPPPPPPPATREDPTEQDTPDLPDITFETAMEGGVGVISVAIGRGELATGGDGFDENISYDFGNVDLSDLDTKPQLMNDPTYSFPKSAEEQGIATIVVDVHILIDENGKAYLMEVLQATYAIDRNDIEKYISQVRFTPPTFAGAPVRTEFGWRLIFGEDLPEAAE